jgi:hypothetical protein
MGGCVLFWQPRAHGFRLTSRAAGLRQTEPQWRRSDVVRCVNKKRYSTLTNFGYGFMNKMLCHFRSVAISAAEETLCVKQILAIACEAERGTSSEVRYSLREGLASLEAHCHKRGGYCADNIYVQSGLATVGTRQALAWKGYAHILKVCRCSKPLLSEPFARSKFSLGHQCFREIEANLYGTFTYRSYPHGH